MKKIGIVTLNGENNYGNRLQNYALQGAILGLGACSETIVLGSPRVTAVGMIKDAIVSVAPVGYPRIKYWRMLKSKRTVFQPFSRAYIKSRVSSVKHISSLLGDYALFISGSDQVWNPRFAGKDFHFLTFAPREKRVSYAASFGVSDIDEDQRNRYAARLKDFRSISVREDDGVKIVKDLTGRDAVLVPDPTMLLERAQWDGLVDDFAYLENENYVVVYALHSLSNERKSQVESYAKANGCKIYQIMGDFYDLSHEIPDPAEFIARIKYAKAVFTDSFHCCVFSIIYHTPFVVFDRTDGQKMSSRLVTLTGRFKLEQAMAGEGSDIDKILESENFDHVDGVMAEYRKVGMEFLEGILKETADE